MRWKSGREEKKKAWTMGSQSIVSGTACRIGGGRVRGAVPKTPSTLGEGE